MEPNAKTLRLVPQSEDVSRPDAMAEKHRRGRMEEQIDENLRRVYAQAVEEQVPDRFLKLLEELRTSGAGKESTGTQSKKGGHS